jgi:hypothetical protein
MRADQVRALYFQNPKFGFHLVQLITRRLLENCASPRGAARPLGGRRPACEGCGIAADDRPIGPQQEGGTTMTTLTTSMTRGLGGAPMALALPGGGAEQERAQAPTALRRGGERRASWHVEARLAQREDQSGGEVMRTDIGVGKAPARRLALSAIIGLALGASAAMNPAAAQSLISADFGQVDDPDLFSGVESQAAALDSAFAAANIWNELAEELDQDDADLSFSALKDSTGNPTTVSFSIAGLTGGFFNNGGGLFGDYVLFLQSFDWRISGLTPGAPYQMVLYGADVVVQRSFNMLVDTDGDGALSDEITVSALTPARRRGLPLPLPPSCPRSRRPHPGRSLAAPSLSPASPRR